MTASAADELNRQPVPSYAELQAQVRALEEELDDLQLLHETIVEHGTNLENELIELVGTLTQVARDLEEGQFDQRALGWLLNRPDELGELGRVFRDMGHEVSLRDRRLRMLRVVIPAGVALSAEKDFNRLLETILIEAQQLSYADSGILYLLTESQRLRPVIFRCTSLQIAQGGTSGRPVEITDRPLYDDNGNATERDVVGYVARSHTRANIADMHANEEFDILWSQSFEMARDYHTQSVLAIPLTSEEDGVIGVLQLINATAPETGAIIPFSIDDVVESLVLLASAALSSYRREERLHQEITRLQIQIDAKKQAQQVSEITETDFFQDLQSRANQIRRRSRR